MPYVAMPYMDKVKANGLEGKFPIPMAAAEKDSIVHCIAWKVESGPQPARKGQRGRALRSIVLLHTSRLVTLRITRRC